jgi:arylformamidase
MSDRLPVASFSGGAWIDVSRPLSPETPVWPGDRPVDLDQRREGELMVSAFSSTCHAGTHIDAPLHMSRSGAAVHDIPLDRLIGPAEVIRLPEGCRAASSADLPPGWVPRFSRVLLRTDSHPVNAAIDGGFTGLSAELVEWLGERGVLTVGIDTPSVDEFDSVDLEAHHALTRRGMTWIEGLDLKHVEAGNYLMVVLPLPLRDAEAAPVRAIVRRIALD